MNVRIKWFDVHSVIPLVLWQCWLHIRKSVRPAKNATRCWHGYLSAAKCTWLAYGPADATATLIVSSLKSRLV